MNKTPLYEQHVKDGGKLVDFFGWQLPLHYGSQLEEHKAVRGSAGMFDVSHMTIIDVLGAGGRLFLRYLLTNDIDKISIGQAFYTCMLNAHGGVIDDLIVYYRSPDNYRLILNAATHDKDVKWIQEQAKGFSVGLLEQPEFSILAVQGPAAIETCLRVVSADKMDVMSTLRPFEMADFGHWLVARTGYTGEDGFELIVPNEEVVGLWQSLRDAGVQPCGLGARDSLRLEAGMMLYGQDLDETKTPLESSLAWAVKLDDERDFIGKGALLAQKQHGIKEKIVGLVLEDRGVLRRDQVVKVNGQEQGIITSGGFSPTLNKSIALARVAASIADDCEVDVRGKMLRAKVTKPRFVKKGKVLI